ncbi:hypothetical protein [Bacillus sp. (in: firmicutes)]|uniref:hypothetical protein n=1 Tax=Bacillus sp. TaxID=1409 RepID=UPI0023EFE2EC|nr:hypothetical protein [Bacillus sp. (in: firmicutes)]
MKKLFSLIFIVILASIVFAIPANAISGGSAYSYNNSPYAGLVIEGSGKYMKFTCKYMGGDLNSIGGGCQLEKSDGTLVKSFLVGGNNSYESTDVWLNKNEKYKLISRAIKGDTPRTVTATIKER